MTTSERPAVEPTTRGVDAVGNGHDPAAPPSSALPRRASRRARAAARRQGRQQAATVTAPAAASAARPSKVAESEGLTAPVGAAPPAGSSKGLVGEFVGLYGGGPIAPEAPEVEPAPEPTPPPSRPPLGKRARRVRRRRRIVATAMALLVGLGAGLVVVGWHRVRNSTAGTYVDATLRPDEPGYVALVTPTPTLLVLQRDATDKLVGISLLTLRSQDEGGAVLLIPTASQAPYGTVGMTLASVYADTDADTVAAQVELMLNVAIGETVEVDDAGWNSLVEPVGSVSMNLTSGVGDWQAGRNDFAAADVGPFLSALDEGESELARLDRQELFWNEWLPRVAADGPGSVPGETDVGLGRFVRGLSAGTTDVEALPVAEVTFYGELFEIDEDLAAPVIARTVPYPQESAVGSRIRVRLLNGTTEPGLAIQAAQPLVEGGAEIAVSGNAASFGETQTRIIYGKERMRAKANSLRDALGVGVVEKSSSEETVEPAEEADRIDVTVVLGADAPEVLRRLESAG